MKEMNQQKRIVWKDGEKTKMSYEDVCHDLGFAPQMGFVRITTAGTIAFSVGKPNEVKALLCSVKANGYKPSQSLVRSAN